VAEPATSAALVIGLGNEFRCDDGAGIAAARRLRDRAAGDAFEVWELQNDPTALLDAGRDRATVVVLDTMRSGAAPGTILRFDAGAEGAAIPEPAVGSASTHAIGLSEAIELGRALDRLPARLVVYAIEGRRFDAGIGLSDELQAALPRLVEWALEEVSCGAVRLPLLEASGKLALGNRRSGE
jgi:hydrogenase maturation protease